jgi:short-subunit dehydrogenase
MSERAPRIVILGALSAVAAACARAWARQGASLVLAGRDAARLALLAEDLTALGAAQVGTAALDLEAAALDAPRHLAGWRDVLGGVDVVLLAYGWLGDPDGGTDDGGAIARAFAVNLVSAAQWSAAAAALMRAQGSGTLLVITSVSGDRGRSRNTAYAAAKAGLSVFVQGLAHGLAGTGARAVALKLGFVATPMTAGFSRRSGLWSTPEQVAPGILRAARRGGPIQYAPGWWRWLMLAVRLAPSALFHRARV